MMVRPPLASDVSLSKADWRELFEMSKGPRLYGFAL